MECIVLLVVNFDVFSLVSMLLVYSMHVLAINSISILQAHRRRNRGGTGGMCPPHVS